MTTHNRIVLLANGDMLNKEYALAQLQADDLIIAANGGTRLAYALQKVPHMVIGDRDSLPPYLQQWLQNHQVPSKQHPIEKDETDLELAIRYATELNPKKILFLGITGGRTDHMLANFSLLAEIAKQKIVSEVIVNQEHIYGITEKLQVSGKRGDTISLLPWGGDVEGVTTEGMKWELQNEPFPFGPARGISNVMMQDHVTITLKIGVLLVIHQKGEVL
jgi:thiamine pyrophosphokinase